ncbi:hypothetical protein [Streptomyces sp. NPDC048659]|uniref:hypothetical protein n=1 Tax=Streptomyces sp. NPDC048659 TaxID=3155489 RepID=UPI003422AD87
MTDISTEPVVGITAPAPPPPNTPLPAPAAPAAEQPVKDAPKVEHTPGGWPVVPLATTGANGTISGVAAAALAAGPAGAAVAAAGAVLIGGAVLARRAARSRTAKTTTRAAKKVPTPRQPHSSGSSSRGTGNRNTGTGAHRAGGGRSSSGASRTPAGRTGSSSGTGGSSASGRSPKSPGRMGQVKALRQDARSTAAGQTRAQQRAGAVKDRRNVADTRRNTPTHRPSTGTGTGTGKHSGKPNSGPKKRRSPLGGRARGVRDAAVKRARNLRDRSTARAVEGARGRVQAALTAKQAKLLKRAARRDARRQLWRSAARKQGRRLLAALLAAPVGAIGLLTTPLGRKLGIKALQYPGRRLYRRLMRTAEEQRAARDAAIRERLAAAEAAIDADLAPEQQIGDKAERPTFLTPAAPSSSPLEVTNVSGFKFEEAAAEMEAAARTYDPETAMEIFAMVEGLPEALQSIANTFLTLAERSDNEFPLEKPIAVAFDEIYGALMRAVDSSADLGPLFRQVHEQDIARHEEPRNGIEAEKGWNV